MTYTTNYTEYSNFINKYGIKFPTADNVAKCQFANALVGSIGQLLLGGIELGVEAFSDNTYETGGSSKTENEVETPKKQSAQELEKEVKEIFQKRKLEFPQEITNEVVKKYETMKKYNCGKRSLEDRVIDYANGLNNYGKFEQGVIKEDKTVSYQMPEVATALKEGNLEKYKSGYKNAAEEYIELSDNKKGNGSIDFREFIANEAANADLDIENMSNADLIKALESSYITFDLLDSNGDYQLDKNEIASLLRNIAVQKNNGAEITYDEHETFQTYLKNYGTAVLGLNKDDSETFKMYMERGDLYQNAYNSSKNPEDLKKAEKERVQALALLKEKSTLSKSDFDNIVNNLFGNDGYLGTVANM